MIELFPYMPGPMAYICYHQNLTVVDWAISDGNQVARQLLCSVCRKIIKIEDIVSTEGERE